MTPTELRELLASAGLSQRAAAMHLCINERTMRRYAAGRLPIPHAVAMAVKYLVKQSLLRGVI